MSETASPNASEWFRALVESAPDVYFRYRLAPTRRFDYLSPSVETLTGHRADAFHDDPALCLGIVAREDRRLLRQMLRASRGLTLTVHVRKGRTTIPVEVRTVAVTRSRRVIAIEGVARTLEAPLFTHGIARPSRLDVAMPPSADAVGGAAEPVQQRLMALLGEVHALLHRALPPPADAHRLRLGHLVLDLERLAVTERGTPVPLTPRETQVLRYLLQRPGRVVSREQLLNEVWGAGFEGNDRAVDVHVSRLRRKLPSLAGRLVAVKGLGYRLDDVDSLDRAS